MKNHSLVILTSSFPFGRSETFLEDEIKILSEHFAKIEIFPLFNSDSTAEVRNTPNQVIVHEPLLSFHIKNAKRYLLFHGIFSVAPLFYFIRELISKGKFFPVAHFRNLATETLITRSIMVSAGFRELTGKIRPGVVLYSYWGDKSAGIIPFVRKTTSCRIVCRFHGSDLYQEIKGGYIPFRERLLGSLDCAIFISAQGMRYQRQRYPQISFRAELFRLGVRPGIFTSGSDDGILRIVSCSNVVPLKRVDLIMKAVALLEGAVEWTHFGGGPMYEQLIRDSSGLKPSIRFSAPGYVSNQTVLEHYRANPVDLFINVSTSEGLPVSVMEAFAFGIPCLATQVGGVGEIVTDGTGFLIPVQSGANDIADHLRRFIRMDRPEKIKMRERAFLQWSQNYDAEKNYHSFGRFLEEL